MLRISDEIEINRSPADVRAVLLDFPSWPEWLKSGLIITSKRKSGSELKNGDKIHSDFNGIKLKPVVIENTLSTFQWKGSFHGLLVGHRRFFFKESEKNPGGTTLVQNEDISGLLSSMFKNKEKGQGKIARDAMRKLNTDLKTRAESV